MMIIIIINMRNSYIYGIIIHKHFDPMIRAPNTHMKVNSAVQKVDRFRAVLRLNVVLFEGSVSENTVDLYWARSA